MPTEYLFEDDVYNETIEHGDAEPEYWKEVANGYWISNLGHLYSFRTHKVLKPKPLDKEGHLGYCLYINGERKYFYQHRLLAECFVMKDDPSFDVVRHLNGDPACNELSNLELGTQKENWKDTYELGNAHFVTPEEREIGIARLRKPTRAINVKTGEVREYRSLNDAVRDLGVQQSNAYKVIFGERTHTCGWKFEYINET